MNTLLTKTALHRPGEALLAPAPSAGDVALALARQLSEAYGALFQVICEHGIRVIYPHLPEGDLVSVGTDASLERCGNETEELPDAPSSTREKVGVARWITREQRLATRLRAVRAARLPRQARTRRERLCRRLVNARVCALNAAELDRRVVDRFLDELTNDVTRARRDAELEPEVAARYGCTWATLQGACSTLGPMRARAKRQRAAMVRQNRSLVEMLARRFSGRGVADDDLVQEGTLGLMRAIDKFDPARGYRFSTYAQWWIRQGIARAVQDQGRTIRLPVHLNESLGRLRRVERRLSHDLGREPRRDEIAAAMELSEKQVQELQQRISRETSLHKPVGSDGNAELGDLLADDNADRGLESAEHNALQQQLCKAMSCLDARSRFVLEARHGLQGQSPMTLSDIGKRLGVTRERVRQIEHEALERLRRTAHRQHLDEFV